MTKEESGLTNVQSEPQEVLESNPDPRLIALELGVWKVTMLKDPASNLRKHISDLTTALPLFKRLAVETYRIEPFLFLLYICSRFWAGVERALLLWLSSRILQIMEVGLTRGHLDKYAILSATAARIICICAVEVVQWWTQITLPILKSRIQAHFELHLMKGDEDARKISLFTILAKLRIDLPTSQEPRSKNKITAQAAWHSFTGITDFFTDIVRIGSQIALIFETSRAAGDPFFALVCLAKPIVCSMGRQSLWSKAHVVSSNNEHYGRVRSLLHMSSTEYRADVISGDLADYIADEFQKASDNIKGLSDEWVGSQYGRRDSPAWDTVVGVLGDLPMVYCAIMAILHPSKFTVSAIAILQQSASTLRWSLESVLENADTFRRQLVDIRNLYESASITNTLVDGQLPFPDPLTEKNAGMSLELKNVSFSYPGSKSTKNALNNVSLSIKAGQLVVIVGANGSGKSSLIKIFTRMYDPQSGQILCDGQPIQSYHLSDLHQATATLTQDHHLFPISLAENIGLGNTKCVGDKTMIASAAILGGADTCIAKLVDGADTILDPLSSAYGSNLVDDPEDPLQKELQKLRKKIELSGGEKQRVVASRAFMRFTSGKIKFVVVDEPSSALDPEGEQQLFDNLRSVREGKTMVFVTHRFGHLTRHADLIICMKDGDVAESGKHEELLALGGEYAKLYNIQASAFVSEAPAVI